MICPFCRAENPNFANFCRNCSVKLRTPCDCRVKDTEFDCGQDRCPKQYSKAKMLSMYNAGKITKREVKEYLGLLASDADDVLKVNILP